MTDLTFSNLSPDAEDTASITGMPRAKKRALLQFHLSKINAAQREVDEARAPFDAAKDKLTAAFHDATSDLGKRHGYTRKYLGDLAAETRSKVRETARDESRRVEDRIDLSLPVAGGLQMQLALGDLEGTPEETKELGRWEYEGFLLGRAGRLNYVPDGCPPRYHQAVMRAAEAGQALTQSMFLEAQAYKDEQAAPQAEVEAKPLNDLPEPGTPEHDAALRESERLARASLGVPQDAGRAKRSKPTAANDRAVAA